jgi:uncharacterized SAM-binding protein YcdF (DUF218 family)
VTLRRWALGATLPVLVFVAGFVWFAVSIQSPSPPPPHTDGIVVLTGGADRVETALRRLQAGGGDRLLVSGVAHGTELPDISRYAGFDPQPLAGRVTIGHAATSTFGNAEEAASWAQAYGLHSLTVVTAGYHMNRALLELGRTMPGIVLYPLPVTSPSMHRRSAFRVLAVEYVKLLAAWCGLSEAVDGWDHPVGKYVSG